MPRKQNNAARCTQCNAEFIGRQANTRLTQHMAEKHTRNPQPKNSRRRPVQSLGKGFAKLALDNARGLGLAAGGVPIGHKTRLGNTLEGSRWAYHALHPMSERDMGPQKIPDGATADSTADEPRGAKVISCPTPWRGKEGDTWDVQIAAIPTPELPIIHRVRKGGEEAWGPWTPVRVNDRMVEYGVTLMGHHGGNPESFLVPEVKRLPILQRDVQAARFTRGGMTITFTGATLYNEGVVCGGSFGGTPKTEQITLTDKLPKEISLSTSEVLFLNEMPLNETDLGYLDKRYETLPAKEGIYIPFKFVSKEHPFKATDGTTYVGEDEAKQELFNFVTGIPVAVRNVGVDPKLPINIRDEFVWDAQNSWDASGVWDVPTVSCYLNRQIAFAMFTGLDTRATLHVKTKDNFECIANPTSWLALSQTSALRRDDPALSAVLDLQREYPSAYPAKYNEENLLENLLFDTGPKVLGAIDPTLGSIANFTAGKIREQRGKVHLADHIWI